MEKKKKYYALNSESLSKALAYIGFKYYKFDDMKYGKIYSFENTEDLHEAIKDLNKLKDKFNNK